MIRSPSRLACFAIACAWINAADDLRAATVAIVSDRDNTMYANSPGFANGAGMRCFAGANNMGSPRRALLHFDIAAAVPPASTITSAELVLNCSRTTSGPETITLHRLSVNWGEGGSIAPGEEGQGAMATIGEATWSHAFFATIPWAVAGGDFSLPPSASTIVDLLGAYSWGSNPTMVANVQGWLDTPATNFGWIMRGNEITANTSKRFDTRENTEPTSRPQLIVMFDPPVTCQITAPLSGAMLAGDVSISFDADDVTASAVTSTFEYSTDSGATFLPATAAVTSPIANPDVTRAVPFSITFIWDSIADGVGALASASVTLRVTVATATASSICEQAVTVDNVVCTVCGNCNSDASGPNVIDALVGAQIAVGIFTATPVQTLCCDVDSTGTITILDSLAIAQFDVGLPITLSCP